ncbi:MAG: hypothetical protein JWN64_140 [Parcubacteria group bacterium]|nr:hypothetical protein [Parcubacteria group bacterium]
MFAFWIDIAGILFAIAGNILFGWAFGARKIQPDGLWTLLILFLGFVAYLSGHGLSTWAAAEGAWPLIASGSWWVPFSGPVLCVLAFILTIQVTRIIRKPKEEAEHAAKNARAARWAEHRHLAFALGYAMQVRGQTGYSDALENFLNFLRERNPNVTEEGARELATSEMAARAVGR